jgi:hypothetical protein
LIKKATVVSNSLLKERTFQVAYDESLNWLLSLFSFDKRRLAATKGKAGFQSAKQKLNFFLR